MSHRSTKTSMPAVAGPAPLCTTVLVGANYIRQHANLLVSGQIISGQVRALQAHISFHPLGH
jgi:hypothetical protein